MKRVLKLGALVLAALVVVAFAGLAILGLPAPPAIKAEDVPRVSWKRVWQGYRMVRRFEASRRFGGWFAGERRMLVQTGTARRVHVVDAPGAPPRRLEGMPDHARYLVQSWHTPRPYFVFSLDEGGSERYRHYRFDLEKGTSEALTAAPARSYTSAFDREGRCSTPPPGRRRFSPPT